MGGWHDRKLARKDLEINNDTVLKVKINKRNSPGLISKWESGIAAFSRLVRPELLEGLEGKIKKDQSGRAYYLPTDKSVYLNRYSGPRTVIHEFGHFLEDEHEDIHQALLNFYARRTSSDNLEWLGGGYGLNEMTKRDKFIDPYMGKYYFINNEQVATELLSMGLEMLFEDPLRLATEDPEYFDFIISLVQ